VASAVVIITVAMEKIIPTVRAVSIMAATVLTAITKVT
jgi:hypothetical protein